MSQGRIDFALDPALDPAALAAEYGRRNRLQIADFLCESSANALRAHLERTALWRHLFNHGERIVEVDSAEWDALPAPERAQVDNVLERTAAYDFQYRYDTIRVDERLDPASAQDPLEEFAAFMASPPVLEILMRITGSDDLAFADCQATRYRRGDFLTPHDDQVDGKRRQFAYVLGLTDPWLPRWGGLLHFVSADGGIDATIVPRFNALSLFAVGQSHFVSEIATCAPHPRLSVTGWLRTERPAAAFWPAFGAMTAGKAIRTANHCR